ncbi:MAG TPA: GxxExxY protein [Gemmatimonadaceae bacterium]|nr:GxxExxY protein [Gemmatimonadaceae bacterium]
MTSDIIGAMYETHQEFGFGYRELVYSRALEVLLTAMGHRVDREVAVTVYFRGIALARQVMDMIVDDKVLVEIKATERLHPAGTSQLFNYLCATTLEVGLLLHFGREARAHRVFCENRFKRHGRLHRDHDAIADHGRIND